MVILCKPHSFLLLITISIFPITLDLKLFWELQDDARLQWSINTIQHNELSELVESAKRWVYQAV